MAVSNFLLLSRSDREYLRERLTTAVTRWQQEWCFASTPMGINVDEECASLDANAAIWQTVSSDKDGLASLSVPDMGRFLAGLVGSDGSEGAEGAAARTLVEAALRALGAAICEATVGSVRALRWSSDAPSGKTAQGYVAVRCYQEAAEITIVLHPSLTHVCLRRQAANPRTAQSLAPVRMAVAGERVVLQVSAGESELALPELATLGVGDVIKLNRRLDQPALVTFRDGIPVCAGHLGTQANYRAVQLTVLPDRKDT